ncbi:DegT/DnrJ/EryC1/StrS family aminotransferase [Halobacteriovorax sp. FRX-2]
MKFLQMRKDSMIPVLEPFLTDKAKEYVNDCLDTNWISSKGKYVQKFEEYFGEKFGYENVMSVSNGTTALHLALEVFNIGEGDEVIVPDLTFAASINCVFHAHATPVIADVEKETWNISVDDILSMITDKTKAVIVVHLYGQAFDVKMLKEKLPRKDILIIEDCAEALGAKVNNEYVGTYGDAATFSFFGNKVITTGEGGAIVYKNKNDLEKSKVMRDHGMSPAIKYQHDYIGYNYRMTNIQAAIGLSQLEFLDELVKVRKQIFNFYDSYIESLGFKRVKSTDECPWLYTTLVPEGKSRDSLIEFLAANGIETRPMFKPMSSMDIYRNVISGDIKNSKYLSERGISLPSSYSLSPDQLNTIRVLIEGWTNE